MPLRLEPVFEAPYWEDKPPWPWAVADLDHFSLVAIHPNMSDAHIGSLFARLATENEFPYEHSVAEAMQAMVDGEDDLTLAGGVRVIQGDLSIPPGCCSGVEKWREWVSLVNADESPWLGHDPWPWLDAAQDQLTLWADGGADGVRIPPAIVLHPDELVAALHELHRGLVGFVDRFRGWCSRQGAADASAVASKLDSALKLSAPIGL